jgi:hypothetical protein
MEFIKAQQKTIEEREAQIKAKRERVSKKKSKLLNSLGVSNDSNVLSGLEKTANIVGTADAHGNRIVSVAQTL